MAAKITSTATQGSPKFRRADLRCFEEQQKVLADGTNSHEHKRDWLSNVAGAILRSSPSAKHGSTYSKQCFQANFAVVETWYTCSYQSIARKESAMILTDKYKWSQAVRPEL